MSGGQPLIVKSADIDGLQVLDRIRQGEFSHVVLSPGPGSPSEHLHLQEIISAAEAVPLLGVCLGHQALAQVHGLAVTRASLPVHGEVSRISHTGTGLFHGIPSEFRAVRYHSLAVQRGAVSTIKVHATTTDGSIMAIEDVARPHWGIQFHPEAHLTEFADTLIGNFLRLDPGFSASPRRNPHRQGSKLRAHQSVEDDSTLVRHLVLRRELDIPTILNRLGKAFPTVIACRSQDRFTTIGVADAKTKQIRQLEGGSQFLEQISADLREDHSTGVGDSELPFVGGWMGYMAFEALEERAGGDEPAALWIKPEKLIVYDHHRQLVHLFGPQADLADLRACLTGETYVRDPQPLAGNWRSGSAEYLQKIDRCLGHLRAGDSYEICLTDRFVGTARGAAVDHYVGKSAYAAYVKDGTALEVVSNSPELFLSLDRQRTLLSKPIKGTAARSLDQAEDAAAAEKLKADPKTRAENMMVVDLTRNDLSVVCEVGSVRVSELMEVESQTVHSLVSSICGTLRADLDFTDAIKACFPPPSMTGAPKQRTLEIIRDLEVGPRGIYSGCIGFIAADGRAQLNVAIRTLVRQGEQWSVGAGGAIVLGSNPADELAERNLKAEALINPEGSGQ